jgi:hypothetical protein
VGGCWEALGSAVGWGWLPRRLGPTKARPYAAMAHQCAGCVKVAKGPGWDEGRGGRVDGRCVPPVASGKGGPNARAKGGGRHRKATIPERCLQGFGWRPQPDAHTQPTSATQRGGKGAQGPGRWGEGGGGNSGGRWVGGCGHAKQATWGGADEGKGTRTRRPSSTGPTR